MINLGFLSRFPSTFKERESSVKDVKFINISAIRKNENLILIDSSTGKYRQKIEIYDKEIHLNSQCKALCTCQSFQFEFANSLFKLDGLLDAVNFIASISKRPKQKNQYNVASGCKHLVALTRQVVKIKIKQ